MGRDGRLYLAGVVILAFVTLWAPNTWSLDDESPGPEDDLATARRVVKDAEPAFADFIADPNMSWFRAHLKDAKGLLIVPLQFRAGFFLGGSGGTGALFARDEQTGQWSYPAFYTVGSVSLGLQFGAQAAQVILMVMSEDGLNKLMSMKVKLGADASVAAGPVGAGAQAATSDILQFSRAKGLFAGVSVEGAVVAPREKVSEAYYGRPITPEEIVKGGKASNPEADPLRAELAKYAN